MKNNGDLCLGEDDLRFLYRDEAEEVAKFASEQLTVQGKV